MLQFGGFCCSPGASVSNHIYVLSYLCCNIYLSVFVIHALLILHGAFDCTCTLEVAVGRGCVAPSVS